MDEIAAKGPGFTVQAAEAGSLTLRPFGQPDDLPKGLRFFGECNRLTGLCGYMHTGDFLHFLSNGLRGRDPSDHVFLYESSDSDQAPAAVVIIFPARRTGSFDISVHPRLRENDLERRLTVWADEQVRNLTQPDGTPLEAVGVDVVDRDAAKRDLLASLGYVAAAEPHQVYSTRPLSNPIPEPVLPPGFVIRSSKGEEEADALGEVHSSAFGSTWKPGDYANVMRTPGYQAERELVVVAPDGRLAAFLVYWPDHVSQSGLFEPAGCHQDFRRIGLTRALLYEGMRRLRDQGITTAVVEPMMASENPAAYALYESVGFRPLFGFVRYRKSLG